MSAQQQVQSYIGRLERRLRLGTIVRGAAVLTAVALLATIALVIVANARAFSSGSVTGARLALICIVGAAAAFGLALPLSRVNRRRATIEAERIFPQFQQRLETFLEKDAGREPFLELLAADTLELARRAKPEAIAPTRTIFLASLVGAASLAVLLWLIAAAPGVLGYGSHLLWTGRHEGGAPLYDLKVTPGDATVRRNTDEIITAQPIGMLTSQARLYARYQSASKWEPVVMQPQPNASGYQFVFTALPESVEYYIEAGVLQSRHFTIRVVDQPGIKQIKVTYHFPPWTALPDAVEERGGDLRAVEGTKAELEISTDRPLTDGRLALNDGRQVRLSPGEKNHYKAFVDIDKDDVYHFVGARRGTAGPPLGGFFHPGAQGQSPGGGRRPPGTRLSREPDRGSDAGGESARRLRPEGRQPALLGQRRA